MLRILGIDPGTATTGYGIIQFARSGVTLVDFGWIKTEKDRSPQDRLDQIYQQLLWLIRQNQPDVLVVERLFFNNNAKTAASVWQAQGVIMLAAARRRIPVVEYTPGEVKLVVSGDGRAKKPDMKRAVRKFLKVRAPKHKKTYYDDVADALSVALCHAIKLKGGERKYARV